MKRVTGIGGIFFKSESPPQLYDWYENSSISASSARIARPGSIVHWRRTAGSRPPATRSPRASQLICIPERSKPEIAAVTVVDHIGVHFWQIDDVPSYEFCVFRSFAPSFWQWSPRHAPNSAGL